MAPTSLGDVCCESSVVTETKTWRQMSRLTPRIACQLRPYGGGSPPRCCIRSHAWDLQSNVADLSWLKRIRGSYQVHLNEGRKEALSKRLSQAGCARLCHRDRLSSPTPDVSLSLSHGAGHAKSLAGFGLECLEFNGLEMIEIYSRTSLEMHPCLVIFRQARHSNGQQPGLWWCCHSIHVITKSALGS